MNGAIDFITTLKLNNYFIVKGMTDINNNSTKFTQDINLNSSGNYCDITFSINGADYVITKISKIIDDSTLYAGKILKNGFLC